MNTLFVLLLVVAMAAVLASLFGGLFFMARGGASDPRKSNRLMQWRVGLQGLSLILFALALLAR
jgi:hypothetical protein